jgi:hypothetical protein
MPVHPNSIASLEQLDISKRQREVLSVFLGARRPMTDREALALLGYGLSGDVNKVQPRITELLKKGILREADNTKCTYTGRTVRRCEVVQ